jgi:hypothetical protein
MRTIYNRTRHIILILLGATVLALGPAVPIASAASNNGSVKDGQTRASEEQCDMYFQWFMDDLNQFMRNAGTRAGDDAYGQMQYTKQQAADRGCEWAQRVQPPGQSRPGQAVSTGRMATR